MTNQEKLEAVTAVLAQLEELDLEDRWAVLEQALEISTAAKPPELKIMQDTDPAIKPRECDNLGLMVYWHSRYVLGDSQPTCCSKTWFEDNVDPKGVYLPLFIYDHSGITMQTKPFTCPFDSGQIGWIYASPEAIKTAFPGVTFEEAQVHALKALEFEVKDFDCHLRGQVWGFEYGDDSCWGFVGDELEATGIKEYLPEVAHSQLEAAWEART